MRCLLFQNKQIFPPSGTSRHMSLLTSVWRHLLLLLEWDKNKVVRTIASMGLLCPF